MEKQIMKNRVLFINPPLSSTSKAKFTSHQFPIGFLYMASLLEKNSFIVKILDCPLFYKQKRKINKNILKFGLFPEEIKKVVQEFKPDIVGVSCSFSMFESDSFEIIDLIKKINKKIIIVVGGAHASSNPEFVLRNKNIDLVIVGEGELTMLEIAEKLRDNKSLKNIKGTALLDTKFKQNNQREPVKNLDDLEPAWHLIDFRKYFEHPDNHSITMRHPSINIITSRGCPGNCVFCSVHTVWGRRWRAISAKKVVSQIEYLHKNFGIKHFRINDDNLTLDKKRIIEICDEIVRRKLEIKWDTPSGLAIWTLNKEVLDKMKKAGYYRITFGIESGSKNTLKYIGKNIDLKKSSELIDYCHKIGLWVASFFVIGFPYEKKEEIEETINYIVNSKINFPFVFIAQPYPGTRMYQDFQKENLILDGVLETSTPIITKYNTKYLTADELIRLRNRIYKKFYLKKIISYTNPYTFYNEFLSKIRSFEDLRYIFKVMNNLFTSFL